MALHVLAVLAYKNGDRVSSQMLAASVNTNPVIIRRLLLALQRARLVETRKGPGLGSRLSRAPARISLAEIFRAVDGEERFVMPGRKPNAACPIGHHIRPAIHQVFVSARAALERDLSKRTLAELMAELRGEV
jgi:Rrf2 family protein